MMLLLAAVVIPNELDGARWAIEHDRGAYWLWPAAIAVVGEFGLCVYGSHDDMRSGTHSPLWNPRGVLDIRPGAGNAKNGEGERLGVAIRGDDVRFARQHDRLQFAGGVDECECVAHIGFFHDPVLCAPAAGLVILTGNSRTWLAIAVFTGHVKNPWKRRNEAVYGGIPTFCADIALKDAPTSTSDRCFFIISSSLFPSSSFSPSFSFLPPPDVSANHSH